MTLAKSGGSTIVTLNGVTDVAAPRASLSPTRSPRRPSTPPPTRPTRSPSARPRPSPSAGRRQRPPVDGRRRTRLGDRGRHLVGNRDGDRARRLQQSGRRPGRDDRPGRGLVDDHAGSGTTTPPASPASRSTAPRRRPSPTRSRSARPRSCRPRRPPLCPATQLAFGQQPTDTLSGATIAPVVTVRLLDNNLTSSTASVSLAITSGTGGVGATPSVLRRATPSPASRRSTTS